MSKENFSPDRERVTTGWSQAFVVKFEHNNIREVYTWKSREHWLAVEIILMIKILYYNLESRS